MREKCSKTRLVAIALSVMLGVNINAGTQTLIKVSKTDKDDIIFKKHLELCKIQNSSNLQASRKISNITSLIRDYDYGVTLLAKGDKRNITRQIKQIMNNIKYKKRDLGNYTKRINSLNKQLKVLKVDKIKQAELVGLEAKQKEILAEMDKIKQPFIETKNKFFAKQKNAAKNTELSALLRPLVTAETNINETITSKSFSANFNTAFASNNWYVNNKRIAWAHIRIRPIPNRLRTKEKLAGKYPIASISKNSMWFWVGNYNICIVIDDNKYKSIDKVKELAQKLFKLPGLEKSSSAPIVKSSIVMYEFVEQNRKNQNAATQKLDRERHKLRREISALAKQGYKSPEATAKMKNDLDTAKAEYAAGQNRIATLSELEKNLKLPPAQYKNAIAKLKRKAVAMRQQLIADCIKIKTQKSKIISNADFNIANTKYQAMIKRLVRIPESKEFATINQITSDARFGASIAYIKWNLYLPSMRNNNKIQMLRGSIGPCNEQGRNKGMIDDKYIIYYLHSSSIRVKVGSCIVTLSASSPPFYGKDSLIKDFKELYDLDAIANLSK